MADHKKPAPEESHRIELRAFDHDDQGNAVFLNADQYNALQRKREADAATASQQAATDAHTQANNYTRILGIDVHDWQGGSGHSLLSPSFAASAIKPPEAAATTPSATPSTNPGHDPNALGRGITIPLVNLKFEY